MLNEMTHNLYMKVLVLAAILSLGVNRVWGGTNYVKVTSANDLVVGGEYIIAAEKDGRTYVASGWIDSGTKGFSTIYSGFSINGNTITMNTASPLVFTLGGNSSGYTLKESKKYLAINNDNNFTSSSSGTEKTSKWTYNFVESQNSYVLINVNSNTRYLGFYYESPYNIRVYSTSNYSKYPIANLYKKQTSVTVTLSSECTDGTGHYYGTFSYSAPFVVPSDVTVSEVGITDGKLRVSKYEIGDTVPANTGVMLSSQAAGEYTLTLSSEQGTSVLGGDNRLRATGNGITSEAMRSADENCKYYRLTMHNGSTIGYWWGAVNGEAFGMDANKAYLAVPETQAARMGFSFADKSEVNAVEHVYSNDFSSSKSLAYDLQGRQLRPQQLRHKSQIYIVNRKKVVKKQ
jgi:hypothetical protein